MRGLSSGPCDPCEFVEGLPVLLPALPGQWGAVAPERHRLHSRQSHRRLLLPLAIQSWPRRASNSGYSKDRRAPRPNAQYFSLQLADSRLTRRLFGQILRRIERLTWHPAW